MINPSSVAWRRQDRTILSWIYSSLIPDIMAQIIGYNTSHSAWNALEKTFSSSLKARIMQLRLELQSTKKGSLFMIDYIMKVKGAADNLSAIGEPILEQDQVMNLLGGLGSEYNAVVTAINIRYDKISIEAVHSMLLGFLSNKAQSITSPLCLPVIPPPLITEVVEENTMQPRTKLYFKYQQLHLQRSWSWS